jgi:methanethiol S-methyltransferase
MTEAPTPTVWLPRVVALGGGLVFASAIGAFVVAYAGRDGHIHTGSPAESARAVAIDVALFSAFAWHHSLFARTGLKSRVAAVVGDRLERSAYVWFASLLFLIVVFAWQPVAGVVWQVPSPWSTVGWTLQGVGLLLTGLASRRLGVFELAGIRQAFGRPAPRRDGLVHDGLYGLVRHPLYMAWLLLVWPTPLMTGTRLVMALTSTLYLVVAIPFEEQSIRASFGASYDDYRRRVRWRLVPYVY